VRPHGSRDQTYELVGKQVFGVLNFESREIEGRKAQCFWMILFQSYPFEQIIESRVTSQRLESRLMRYGHEENMMPSVHFLQRFKCLVLVA